MGPVINDKVKVLILLGATAPLIEAAVKKASNYVESAIKIINVNNMIEAVNEARENAEKGDIV